MFEKKVMLLKPCIYIVFSKRGVKSSERQPERPKNLPPPSKPNNMHGEGVEPYQKVKQNYSKYCCYFII